MQVSRLHGALQVAGLSHEQQQKDLNQAREELSQQAAAAMNCQQRLEANVAAITAERDASVRNAEQSLPAMVSGRMQLLPALVTSPMFVARDHPKCRSDSCSKMPIRYRQIKELIGLCKLNLLQYNFVACSCSNDPSVLYLAVAV